MRLSSSGMDTLLSCGRKYQHTYIDKLTGEQPDDTALNFGSAWHKIRANRVLGAPIEEVLDTYPDMPEKEYRTKDRLRVADRLYTERWPVPYRVRDWQGKPAVEVEYRIHIGPDDQTGIIDLWADADTNEGEGWLPWVIDYKSTSYLTGSWVEYYRTSNQFRAYFTAAGVMKMEAVGVLVDVFHVTPGVKKGKDEAERNGCHFYRLPIKYTQLAVEEWYKNFLTSITLAEMYAETGYYPQRAPAACNEYNRPCAFLDICNTFDEETRRKLRGLTNQP